MKEEEGRRMLPGKREQQFILMIRFLLVSDSVAINPTLIAIHDVNDIFIGQSSKWNPLHT